MFDAFRSLAKGGSGQPTRCHVTPDFDLIGHDAAVSEVINEYVVRAGAFNAHGCASIPYGMEEDSRVSSAILEYTHRYHQHTALRMWSLCAAEGVAARALASLAQGAVYTLNCSPNEENRDEFFARGAPPQSRFFVGPFFDVPAALRKPDPAYFPFRDGFDVIFENTSFQMFGPQRAEPLALVKEQLLPGGIMVLVEKLTHRDVEEYSRREKQKDTEFKARYFTEADIDSKRRTILDDMQTGQVDMSQLSKALRCTFAHAVVTWNSGNFYTVIASDDSAALGNFINCMIPPAVPDSYNYEELPMTLFGDVQPNFRATAP